MDAGGEHRQEELHRLPPHAGEPPGEAVGPEQHQGADGRCGQELADPCRVALDEVSLEVAELLARDDDVGELAEARGDAVDDAVLADRAVDDGAGGVDAAGSLFGEDGGAAAVSDLDEVVEGEGFAGQADGFAHRSGILAFGGGRRAAG